MKAVLVAYSSWTGATREIAETIASELGVSGARVELCRASKVKTLGSYGAVALLIPIHVGMIPGEIKRFVHRYRAELAKMPVAFGVVCLAVTEDNEENRDAVSGYIAKVRALAPEIEPALDIGVLGGAVRMNTPEFKRLFPLLKTPLKALAEKPDKRDWDAIRAWARTVKAEICLPEA